MTTHIVLFEPKPELSDEARRRFLQSLRSVLATVADVRRASIGRTFGFGRMPDDKVGVSTYSFAAIVEFDDRDGLQRYLEHPSHDELRRLFWEGCQATVIADVDMLPAESDLTDLLV